MTAGKQAIGLQISGRINVIKNNTPVTITSDETSYFYLGYTPGNSGGEYGYLWTVDNCADDLSIIVEEAVDNDGPWAPVEALANHAASEGLVWSRGDVMWGGVIRLGIRKVTEGTTTARVKGICK